MKHLIKVISLALFLFTMSSAQAANFWTPTQETVNRLYPVVGTTYYISMKGVRYNPAECANDYYYVFRSDHPEFEEYKKLALTAKATGLKLGFALEDGECDGAYPKIIRMYLQ